MDVRSWNSFSTMSSHCTTQRKLVFPLRADPSLAAHQLAPCLCLSLLKCWDSDRDSWCQNGFNIWSCTLPRVSSGIRNSILGLPHVQVTNSESGVHKWTPSLFTISCYIWRKTPSGSEVLAFPQFQEKWKPPTQLLYIYPNVLNTCHGENRLLLGQDTSLQVL